MDLLVEGRFLPAHREMSQRRRSIHLMQLNRKCRQKANIEASLFICLESSMFKRILVPVDGSDTSNA
jgi:hypothetical protein